MIAAPIERQGTIVAVNVGGAVIPVILSNSLVVKDTLCAASVAAAAIVAVAVHVMASPVPGVGIAEPVFMPPVVTAAAALLASLVAPKHPPSPQRPRVEAAPTTVRLPGRRPPGNGAAGRSSNRHR